MTRTVASAGGRGPAVGPAGTPHTLGDLLEIDPEDGALQAYDDLIDERARSTFSRQFFGDDREVLVERLRAESTWSFPTATAASGPFPLVVHSLGRNDYQLESTVLWEYLASHGFVVVVIPQMGGGPAEDRLGFTAPDLQLQARDVALTAQLMRQMPYVNQGPYGIIGHSSGAVVAFLLAESDPDLAAIVSLDGSITTDDGRTLLQSIDWDGGRVRAPLLNIYVAEEDKELWAVEQARGSDRYNVGIRKAIHFDFQNWPLYNALYGVEEPRSGAVRSNEDARVVFLTSIRLTRKFVDAVLNGNGGALEQLRIGAFPVGLAADRVQFRFQPSQ